VIDTNTMLIDVLVDVVNGKLESDKRDLAIEILRYVQQQRTANEPAAVIAKDVYRLWNSDEPKYYSVTPCRLETVSQDGVERLTVVQDEPTPSPALEFIPEPTPGPVGHLAVPLPVIPISDVEQAALTLQAERFSSENVTANVLRLQQEGAKVLSPVEEVEAQINAERDVRARYDAAQANLARLIALRDQQA
jgi:hypothetical protein